MACPGRRSTRCRKVGQRWDRPIHVSRHLGRNYHDNPLALGRMQGVFDELVLDYFIDFAVKRLINLQIIFAWQLGERRMRFDLIPVSYGRNVVF